MEREHTVSMSVTNGAECICNPEILLGTKFGLWNFQNLVAPRGTLLDLNAAWELFLSKEAFNNGISFNEEVHHQHEIIDGVLYEDGDTTYTLLDENGNKTGATFTIKANKGPIESMEWEKGKLILYYSKTRPITDDDLAKEIPIHYVYDSEGQIVIDQETGKELIYDYVVLPIIEIFDNDETHKLFPWYADDLHTVRLRLNVDDSDPDGHLGDAAITNEGEVFFLKELSSLNKGNTLTSLLSFIELLKTTLGIAPQFLNVDTIVDPEGEAIHNRATGSNLSEILLTLNNGNIIEGINENRLRTIDNVKLVSGKTITNPITNLKEFLDFSEYISNHAFTASDIPNLVDALNFLQSDLGKFQEDKNTLITATNITDALNNIYNAVKDNKDRIGYSNNAWIVLNTDSNNNLTEAINEIDEHVDSLAEEIGVKEKLEFNVETNKYETIYSNPYISSILKNRLRALQVNKDDIKIVEAINDIQNQIGDLQDLTTELKESLIQALNEIISNVKTNSDNIGNLNSLTTSNKDSLVEAINELDEELGDLDNLNTTDKSEIVTAINEVIDRTPIIYSDYKNKSTSGILVKNRDNVSGNYSTTFGRYNTNTATNSFVTGVDNSVSGDANFVSGELNNILGNFHRIFGTQNIVINNSNSILGDVNNISESYEVVIGNNNNSSSYKSYIFGENNTLDRGSLNYISGNDNNIIQGSYNYILGGSNTINSSGLNNIIFGNSNNVSKINSIIIGENNIIDSKYSLALGNSNRFIGELSLSIGNSNNILGDNNYIFGKLNYTEGNNNYIFGKSLTIYGNDNIILNNKIKNITVNDAIVIGSMETYHDNSTHIAKDIYIQTHDTESKLQGLIFVDLNDWCVKNNSANLNGGKFLDTSHLVAALKVYLSRDYSDNALLRFTMMSNEKGIIIVQGNSKRIYLNNTWYLSESIEEGWSRKEGTYLKLIDQVVNGTTKRYLAIMDLNSTDAVVDTVGAQRSNSEDFGTIDISHAYGAVDLDELDIALNLTSRFNLKVDKTANIKTVYTNKYGVKTQEIELNFVKESSASQSNDITLDLIDSFGFDKTEYLRLEEKGVANGYAPLDDLALIPSNYLPSYVDDIIEVWAEYDIDPASSTLSNIHIFQLNSDGTKGEEMLEGETGKIYVEVASNETRPFSELFRWSGSQFTPTGFSVLVLGEVPGTAFEGSKGKALRTEFDDHVNSGTTLSGGSVYKPNPHNVTPAQMSLIVNDPNNADNVTLETSFSKEYTVEAAIIELFDRLNVEEDTLNNLLALVGSALEITDLQNLEDEPSNTVIGVLLNTKEKLNSYIPMQDTTIASLVSNNLKFYGED